MDQNRIAEITQELLGAKAIEQLIKQIYAEASPEVRQQFADATLNRLLTTAKEHSFDWTIQHNVLPELALDAIKDHRARALELIEAAIKERLPEIVNRTIQALLDRELGTLKTEVATRLDNALRAAFRQ